MSFERIPEVGKLVREESVPADEADMPVELRERALAVELMLFSIRLPSIKRYESLSPPEFELTPAITLKLSFPRWWARTKKVGQSHQIGFILYLLYQMHVIIAKFTQLFTFTVGKSHQIIFWPTKGESLAPAPRNTDPQSYSPSSNCGCFFWRKIEIPFIINASSAHLLNLIFYLIA